VAVGITRTHQQEQASDEKEDSLDHDSSFLLFDNTRFQRERPVRRSLHLAQDLSRRCSALRHTAVTNIYQASKDLFLYTHPSDQELWQKIRGLFC